jgi:hypothetical protein
VRRVLHPTWANGRPAIAFYEQDGTPHRLLVLESDETGAIAMLHAFELGDGLADFGGPAGSRARITPPVRGTFGPGQS